MRRPRLRTELFFYLALALLATAPAWIVRHPPLQDLPLHVAAIRVLHDFHDPRFAFESNFDLTLGRTQYVFYYLLGAFFSSFVGVRVANVFLMCVYLGGTPLAVRSLCHALGKDERLAILIVPLLVNVMFQLGLLPFMFGVPVMFWALAAAVRWVGEVRGDRRPDQLRTRGAILAVLSVILFYCHVFPFGLFGVGFAALFPWRRPREWVLAALPVIPTLGVMAWWFFITPSGRIARGAVGAKDPVVPLDQALRAVDEWTLDVFRDTTDERTLVAFVLVVLLAWGLAQGDRDDARQEARALIAVPIACLVLYFSTGEERGPVWLFAQRFPILCFMTLVPLLRFPRGGRGIVVTGAALAVAVGSIVNVCRHYLAFERDEVGNVEGAFEQIPEGRKVAALIFDKYSKIVNWGPFVHFGSYYQANKGGVVAFTYAGFPHWPFSFKDGAWPPQAGLPPGSPPPKSWEWRPEDVKVQGELYPFYDYVLTRGEGFHPPPGTFRLKWHDGRWSVWEREGTSLP